MSFLSDVVPRVTRQALMSAASNIAHASELRLLTSLKASIADILGVEPSKVWAEGLLTGRIDLRGHPRLRQQASVLVDELFDEICHRYIDGELVGHLAEPFRRHFASQHVHFQLRAAARTAMTLGSSHYHCGSDSLYVPMLHILGRDAQREVAAELEHLIQIPATDNAPTPGPHPGLAA